MSPTNPVCRDEVYTAKPFFHQSLRRHSEYTVTGQWRCTVSMRLHYHWQPTPSSVDFIWDVGEYFQRRNRSHRGRAAGTLSWLYTSSLSSHHVPAAPVVLPIRYTRHHCPVTMYRQHRPCCRYVMHVVTVQSPCHCSVWLMENEFCRACIGAWNCSSWHSRRFQFNDKGLPFLSIVMTDIILSPAGPNLTLTLTLILIIILTLTLTLTLTLGHHELELGHHDGENEGFCRIFKLAP